MARNLEEVSCGNQGNHSGEALTELKLSEQLEHGVRSTYPSFWDIDDDDDGGPTTSQLYGMYTWNIEDFSRIKRRELCSDVFKIGGYEWYILIYPQGCDVCDHISLFLCVANHDKLLPGWGHFAQFTLAVVNKDPKLTKYSDTLHRFWKKEHDWGWKRFMEFSRVNDGFIDANSLIVKAQIQVIRERAERPFRCLDCQYRRELIRVYLTDVEAICHHLLEQRRTNLGELVKDELNWLRLCSFWHGIDQKRKYLISREKSDVVLSVAVQYFNMEKEVSWTLVMDSLYSGLKCLEWMSKNKRDKEKLTNTGELVVPMVVLEKDMFILVDDVLPLVEMAAIEPLPPKDDKGPQDRRKDGCSGEDLIKDTIEYDERRLTELGRKTIEIFALSQTLSKIDIAIKEVVSLERQEQLICEEEAEAKHGIERDKKSKKKQRKSKPSGQKTKGGKGRDVMTNLVMVGRNDTTMEDENDYENPITGDDISYSSDSLDSVTEVPQHDSLDSVTEVPQLDTDDRGSSSVCSDTDTPEYFSDAESINNDSIQNGKGEKKVPSSSTDDRDSLPTCSTDLAPPLVRNGSDREYLQTNQETQKPPVSARLCDAEPDSVPQSFTLPDNKKEEVTSPQRTLAKVVPFKETTTRPSSPSRLPQNLTSNNVSIGKRPLLSGSTRCTSKPDLAEAKYPKPIEKPSVQQVQVIPSLQTPPPDLGEAKDQKPPSLKKPSVQQVPVISSLQAPQLDLREVKDPKPPIKKPSVQQLPVNSSLQKPLPLLEQSVSAAGRLGSDVSAYAPSYNPQSSHPNATMDVSDCFHQDHPSDDKHQPSIPIERNPSSGMIGRPHSFIMPAAQTTQNVAMSKFTYSEILKNLLDDENGMERFHSSVNNSKHHNLSHQFSVPGNTRTWGGDKETSSSYHDYVSSPLTLSGPLDRGNQGPPGFDGKQRQIVEPEISMRMGTRNSNSDGLSHGGIPGNDHELNMRMRLRNKEPDGLSSYGGIPGDDPELSMRMKLRNREPDGLSSFGGIPGDDPELSMKMKLRNREPDGLSSYGGIPRNDPELSMRMRNREPDGLSSYGGIPRNDPELSMRMRNREPDRLSSYGGIPRIDPELSMRMRLRNREPDGLSSYGGTPMNDSKLSMRNNEPNRLSYGGISQNYLPPHTRSSMRNNELDVLSYGSIPINDPDLSTRMRNSETSGLCYGGIPGNDPPSYARLSTRMGMGMRNNDLDGLSYAGIPKNNPPPHTRLSMRNSEPNGLSYSAIPGNNPPPHARLSMRNNELDGSSYNCLSTHAQLSMNNNKLDGLSCNGIPTHGRLSMRSNELNGSSYNGIPTHGRLSTRNNEQVLLSHLYPLGIDRRRLFPWGRLFPRPDRR